MAEAEGDELVIKVVGDYTDFDEGIRQREGVQHTAILPPGGSPTFGNEGGSAGRFSSGLGTLDRLVLALERMTGGPGGMFALPSPATAVASAHLPWTERVPESYAEAIGRWTNGSERFRKMDAGLMPSNDQMSDFRSAMDSLPMSTGTTYRGIVSSPQVYHAYRRLQQGNTISFSALQSATKSSSIGEDFAIPEMNQYATDETTKRIMFSFPKGMGRDISQATADDPEYAGEEEALLPKGRYRVKTKPYLKGGILRVSLASFEGSDPSEPSDFHAPTFDPSDYYSRQYMPMRVPRIRGRSPGPSTGPYAMPGGSSGGGALARRRDLARFTAMERSRYLEGEWSDPAEGEHWDDPFEGHEILDSATSVGGRGPGGMGLVAGGGGGASGANTINIPNAYAAGAGGGGGMVPPFGPRNGGVGGGPAWPYNFPPYPPNYPPRRRPGINWNANIMPHSMFYMLMFGAFEVARAERMNRQAIDMEGAANSTQEVLQAQIAGIRGSAGGILGSISGFAMDTAHDAGLAPDSPFAAEERLISLEGTTRFQDEGVMTGRENIRSGRIRAATGRGNTVMEMTRLQNQAEQANQQLEERRSFINQQLGATVNRGKGWVLHSDVYGPGRYTWGDIIEPLIKDPLQQAAMRADAKFLTDKIVSNNLDVATARDERNKDIAYGISGLNARGADATDSVSFSSREAALRSLARQQGLEYAKVSRENPEMVPALVIAQNKEYTALQVSQARDQAFLNTTSDTNVIAANLMAARMPYQAARAKLQGDYIAAVSSNANINDPAAQTRLQNELLANLNLLRSQHDFAMQGATHDFSSDARSNAYMMADDPLNARREQIMKAGDAAYRALPADAPEATRVALRKDVTSQLDYANFTDERSRTSETLGLQGKANVLRDLLDRNPVGAQADQIANSTQREIFGFRSEAHEDQAKAAGKLGIQQLELTRRDYLESFRGTQLDLRDFRVDNPRDRENPAAVGKSIDAAIQTIADTLSGSNQTFVQSMAEAIQAIIAK